MKKIVGIVGIIIFMVIFGGNISEASDPNVVWRNCHTGEVIIWIIDTNHYEKITDGRGGSVWIYAPVKTQVNVGIASLDWEIVSYEDLDKDGQNDILWRNKNTGKTYMWLLDGPSVKFHSYLNVPMPDHWVVE